MNEHARIVPPAAGPAYARDLYGWVQHQVALLRAGRLDEVDALKVAEELEDVGAAQYDGLESALRVVLVQILKWDHQPERRSRSWVLSILEHRRRVLKKLSKNPSLRARRDEAVSEAYADARIGAAIETGLGDDLFPPACPYPWPDIMDRVFAVEGYSTTG